MKDIDDMLREVLEVKEDFKKLLGKILEVNIVEIDIKPKEHFDTITEYEFSLSKINLTCENNEKIEVYLKMIKGGKIKESIFCFWSLLYEEYNKKEEIFKENNRKVKIKQKKVDNEGSNIILTFDQSIDYCAEINLVELKNFVLLDKRFERLVKNLEIKSEDILFIGRKNVI